MHPKSRTGFWGAYFYIEKKRKKIYWLNGLNNKLPKDATPTQCRGEQKPSAAFSLIDYRH